MQQIFDTPNPTSLYVELGTGDVEVHAVETAETTVEVTGRDEDAVTVEQRDNQIVVLAPQRQGGFLSGNRDLTIVVSLPSGSRFATRVGSADVRTTGRLGETMVKSGSGDVSIDEVDGDILLQTGSGDIELGSIGGELEVKSGSGDVEVDAVAGKTSISTGSGDVEVGTAGDTVQVKSGSGDARIRDAAGAVSLSTASGDLFVDAMKRGELRANNVSGDIHVVVAAGVPVWTDISTVTGSVHSDLRGAGQPTEGQDYIEMRAKTVSGDVYLDESHFGER